MPLPSRDMPWPPHELDHIAPAMGRWSAWYAGDPAQLDYVYQLQRRANVRLVDRPSQYRGGLVGAFARTFWGQPRGDLAQPKQKLHVPMAADLCQASADLLFAEPPSVTTEDKATNERLEELVSDGMLGTLAEAAELTAALGGGYLRVTWDKALRPDAPFLTTVEADGAWPEFRWGQLTAVTFWAVVRRDDSAVVIRHLERHELDANGNGVVLHGLYQGTQDTLGRVIPLTEVQATAGLADQVVDGNRIDTLTPGLAVTYVPNMRPQRIWRNDPIGRNLGRSDLDGVEQLMDALDETYTSWMRDVRLGKTRVFLGEALLDSLGPGQGAAFDQDREIYAPLNVLANRESTSGQLPIQVEQFAIRFAEHDATATKLTHAILRTAGYSAQTFGEELGSRASGDTTATEVQARERRSFMTRDRKLRHWRPALADVIEKLLAVDREVFGSKVTPQRPQVAFPDGVQESMLNLAQTAAALRTAEAASTETLVQLVHPDWTDDQVSKEVAAIQADVAAMKPPMPDPFAAAGQQPAGAGTVPEPGEPGGAAGG